MAAGWWPAAAAIATPAATATLPTIPMACRLHVESTSPGGPSQLGALTFQRGYHLSCDDGRFRGLSDLAALDGGSTLLAITDRGSVLTLPVSPRSGDTVRIHSLLDASGRAPSGDAEGLTVTPDGAAALIGLGPADRLGDQARHAGARVHPCPTCLAAIDHDADPFDGQRGLGDGGRKHHAAARREPPRPSRHEQSPH